MAVNKCDITKYALEQYNHLKYGTTCKDDSIKAIIENYIKRINCKDFDHQVCYPDIECTSNLTITSTCICEIASMEFNRVSNISGDNIVDVIFSVGGIGNITGCAPPYIYSWSFDDTGLELVGVLNSTELQLKLKVGFNLDYLVFHVTLGLTDANGCTTIKRCVYVPSSLICDESYVECPNPISLSTN